MNPSVMKMHPTPLQTSVSPYSGIDVAFATFFSEVVVFFKNFMDSWTIPAAPTTPSSIPKPYLSKKRAEAITISYQCEKIHNSHKYQRNTTSNKRKITFYDDCSSIAVASACAVTIVEISNEETMKKKGWAEKTAEEAVVDMDGAPLKPIIKRAINLKRNWIIILSKSSKHDNQWLEERNTSLNYHAYREYIEKKT